MEKHCSHSYTQTDIQNTEFALKLVNERPDRQPENVDVPKFDQETQTTIDYRKWRKLEEARSLAEKLENEGTLKDLAKANPKK